jgi:ABC-type Fe3+/spermidine/putrescine transport system ATPase subunit
VRIELDGLGKRYGAVQAVADASLRVAAGELVAILGPSGSGKTTLLRLLAGFARPDAGRVRIDGRDVTDADPRARRVGIVFQNDALFPHLDVAANVAFGLTLRRTPARERASRVAELLALVELPGYERRRPRELSGGERQRVAVARALAIDPLVLALDEPFAALDAAVRRTLRERLRTVHERAQTATVFVTHDADEALAIADRVAVVAGGRIVGDGPPAALYAAPPNLAAMRALGPAEAFADGFARPHDLRIVEGETEAPDARRAVVERVVPLGGRTRLQLRCADGAVLTVERPDDASPAVTPGAAVRVLAVRLQRFAQTNR